MPKRIYARRERDKECLEHRFGIPRRGETGPRRCADCGTPEVTKDLDNALTSARVAGALW